MNLYVSTAIFFYSYVLWAVPSHAVEPESNQGQLHQLIEQALETDGRRKQLHSQSMAIRSSGLAKSTLPDPKLKLGVGGLPTDDFKFNQDPMTNVSVGLMQQFGRGAELSLTHKQSQQQAEIVQTNISVRELEITHKMTKLWLELGYQTKATKIIQENIALMRELEQIIETNYSLGKSESQDLLYVQLQVGKLEERLQANTQARRRIVAQIAEWLGPDWTNKFRALHASNQMTWSRLSHLLTQSESPSKHYRQLTRSPLVKIAELGVKERQTQVEIREQGYHPQFGVEVMYAYRQSDNMVGEELSDLVSAYLTMDLPIFTNNRQDKALASAQYQVGAARFNKDALLLDMNAQVNRFLVEQSHLEQRLDRYRSTLLPQASARIKAIERGYQNNTASFDSLISATSDRLALQLERQRLVTDLNVTNSNLAQLLDGFDFQPNQKKPFLGSSHNPLDGRQ